MAFGLPIRRYAYRTFGALAAWALPLSVVTLPLTEAAADTIILRNFFSEERRDELLARIKPARFYLSNWLEPGLKGDIIEARIDPQTSEGYVVVNVWWRETPDAPKTYAAQPAKFDLTEINYVTLEYDNQFDIDFMLSDRYRRAGPIGSLSWFVALDRAIDPGGSLGYAVVDRTPESEAEKQALNYPGWIFDYLREPPIVPPTQEEIQANMARIQKEAAARQKLIAAGADPASLPPIQPGLTPRDRLLSKNPMSIRLLMHLNHSLSQRALIGLEMSEREHPDDTVFRSNLIQYLVYLGTLSRVMASREILEAGLPEHEMPREEYYRSKIGIFGGGPVWELQQMPFNATLNHYLISHPDYIRRLKALQGAVANAGDDEEVRNLRQIASDKLQQVKDEMDRLTQPRPSWDDAPDDPAARQIWVLQNMQKRGAAPLAPMPWEAEQQSQLIEVSDLAWWALKVIQAAPAWGVALDLSTRIGGNRANRAYIGDLLAGAAPRRARNGTILPNIHYQDRRSGGRGAGLVQPEGTSTPLQHEARKTVLHLLRQDVSNEYTEAYNLVNEFRQLRRERRNQFVATAAGFIGNEHDAANLTMLEAGPGAPFVEDYPEKLLSNSAGTSYHFLFRDQQDHASPGWTPFGVSIGLLAAYYLGPDAIIPDTDFGRAMALELIAMAKDFDSDSLQSQNVHTLRILGALGGYNPDIPPKYGDENRRQSGPFVEAFLDYVAELRGRVGVADGAPVLVGLKKQAYDRLRALDAKYEEYWARP